MQCDDCQKSAVKWMPVMFGIGSAWLAWISVASIANGMEDAKVHQQVQDMLQKIDKVVTVIETQTEAIRKMDRTLQIHIAKTTDDKVN